MPAWEYLGLSFQRFCACSICFQTLASFCLMSWLRSYARLWSLSLSSLRRAFSLTVIKCFFFISSMRSYISSCSCFTVLIEPVMLTFSPFTRSQWCLWKSLSLRSFSQVDLAFSATILAYFSSPVILSILDSIFEFLFFMSVIRPIPKSWKVPFFCNSYHSYWKMFIVFVIFTLVKKFLIKSSITTSLSIVRGDT